MKDCDMKNDRAVAGDDSPWRSPLQGSKTRLLLERLPPQPDPLGAIYACALRTAEVKKGGGCALAGLFRNKGMRIRS